MANGVRMMDPDGEVMVEIYAVERKDNKLIVDVKILEGMRMDMTLLPQEMMKGFKIVLSWGVISYILLVPYFTLREVYRRCLRGSRKRSEEKSEGQR
jgi:hypothetical protein